MVAGRGWKKWIDEYRRLIEKLYSTDASLPPTESHRLNYLRNLLEAGLGTKSVLSEDNRRSDLRVPCEFPAQVRLRNGKSLEAQVRNISPWGVFISLDPLPEVGETIEIEIQTPEGNKIIRPGRVKWLRQTDKESGDRKLLSGAGVLLNALPFEREDDYRELFFSTLQQQILNR